MLERPLTRLLAAIAGLGLLASAFLLGFGFGRVSSQAQVDSFGLLREAERRIRDSAVHKVDDKKLTQGEIRGALESLDDQYAEFLDPAEFRSFQDTSEGHFSGVGLWLKEDDKRLKVVSVLAGTSAAKAGMQSGDVIEEVAGRKTQGLAFEQVVQQIKGTPGTMVVLSVRRGGQPIEFSLLREDIQVPSVRTSLLSGGVGLIELSTFTDGVGSKVREAVRKLTAKGARGLILDLRGNPGGLLEESVDVASAFLEGGRVVSYRQRGGTEVSYDARGPQETKAPLVVLVDEGSASASEIVAGAMQDRRRGIIVGTATYGKGSIQTVFPLSDGSGLKITTASYHTPSGRSIGDEGIKPDVAVDQKEVQLARGEQILREMLAAAGVQQVA